VRWLGWVRKGVGAAVAESGIVRSLLVQVYVLLSLEVLVLVSLLHLADPTREFCHDDRLTQCPAVLYFDYK
jgi:hypothetical protein